MFERFTRRSLTATVAAVLAAVGIGGVTAAASSGSHPAQAKQAAQATQPKEVPGQESTAPENSATDPDNVQAGDQTGQRAQTAAGARAEQPGEQEAPAGQESGSEVPNDDGPTGHADEPGNAAADHQFQGVE